jgi:hypothetical protein
MVEKLTEFNIKFNKRTVMHLIDCMSDNPLYEEMIEEMELLEEEAYSLIDAKALLAFGEITPEISTDKIPEGTKAVYAIITLGGSMSKWSTALFEKGDYVAGMIVNAMADDALFQIDTAIKDTVIDMSKNAKMGITKRLEAPTCISMEAQKVAWEVTNAKQELGVDIMSSYMYDPVKTICQIYLLDEACKEFRTEHNCRECNATKCKLRDLT